MSCCYIYMYIHIFRGLRSYHLGLFFNLFEYINNVNYFTGYGHNDRRLSIVVALFLSEMRKQG